MLSDLSNTGGCRCLKLSLLQPRGQVFWRQGVPSGEACNLGVAISVGPWPSLEKFLLTGLVGLWVPTFPTLIAINSSSGIHFCSVSFDLNGHECHEPSPPRIPQQPTTAPEFLTQPRALLSRFTHPPPTFFLKLSNLSWPFLTLFQGPRQGELPGCQQDLILISHLIHVGQSQG